MFELANLAAAALLFASMLALQQLGLRIGEGHRRESGEPPATGAAEAAVYGLLGLFLAFTFSGAATRFDTSLDLIAEEANAVGNAWALLDMLPAADQPAIRDLFRSYLDARIERYQHVLEEAPRERVAELQHEIWSKTVAAAKASEHTATQTLVLPAVNEMFDSVTRREMSLKDHPPKVVFAMLALLALLASLFAGFALGSGKARHRLHTIGFAAVFTLTLYVIVELEYPRLGTIRVDFADALLVDLRRSMG